MRALTPKVRDTLEQFQEQRLAVRLDAFAVAFRSGIASKQRDRAVRRFRETVKRSCRAFVGTDLGCRLSSAPVIFQK
ncbi:hypothetical protein RFM98_25830 [Mesorhizobium sp. VK9D]|uniref:hypothetical protein n=1 Tax=Mesorhizobium australafricanum TaxID=3072311 RepID=UPI002A2486F4|nr:hypothetical protein [Mesorhizobium sp. VK9D]MDX8456159.1 hypothetical protein [Mesorhizobium sp. VK9D]